MVYFVLCVDTVVVIMFHTIVMKISKNALSMCDGMYGLRVKYGNLKGLRKASWARY